MADTSFEPKSGNAKGAPSADKGTTQGLSSASKSTGNEQDTARMANVSGNSTLSQGGSGSTSSSSSASMAGSGSTTAGSIGSASMAGSGSTMAGNGTSRSGLDSSSNRSASPLVDGDRVLGSHSAGRSTAFDRSEGQEGNARFERGADMLNRLSDRVDDFARERLDMGGIGTRAADYVYGLTDLIDSASRSFQERSPDPFRNELSNKVRRNPVKAVALSLGVGFLIGKLIK